MKDHRTYSDETWASFLNFLLPEEEELSHADVVKELHNAGISTKSAFERLKKVIAKCDKDKTSQSALRDARMKRTQTVNMLRASLGQSVAHAKESLNTMIAQKLNAANQAAFFRKLESTATEDDLQSLLEDLTLLDEFQSFADVEDS